MANTLPVASDLTPDPDDIAVAPAALPRAEELVPDAAPPEAARDTALPSAADLTPDEAAPKPPAHEHKASSTGRFLTPEDLAAASVNPDGKKLDVSPDFLRRAAGMFGGRAFADSHLINPMMVPAEELGALGEKLLLGEPIDDKSAEHLPDGGITEQAKYTLGRTLGMIAGDLPANLARKAAAYLGALTPDESEALINLQSIIHDRKPWTEAGMELGSQLIVGSKGLGALGGLASKIPGVGAAGEAIGAGAEAVSKGSLPGRLAVGAARLTGEHLAKPMATGAAYGAAFEVAKSREGEELEDAIKGGLIGAAFGLGLHGVVTPIKAALGARQRAATYVANVMTEQAGGVEPVRARMGEMAEADKVAEETLTRVVKDLDKKSMAPKTFLKVTTEAERDALAAMSARDAGRVPYSPKAKVKVSDDPLSMEKAEVIGLGGEGESLYMAAAEAAGMSLEEYRDASAFSYVKKIRGSFSRLIGANDAKTPSIMAAKEQQGEEYISRVYDAFRTSERFGRAITELSTANGGSDKKVGILFRVGSYIADNRAVLSAIDRRYGTQLAPLGDLVSGRFNAATVVSARLMAELDKVGNLVRKAEKTFTLAEGGEAPFTAEVMGDALNTGDFDAIGRFTEKQREALKSLSDLQETARQAAESFHDFRGLRTDKLSERIAADKPGWFSSLDTSPMEIKPLARGPEGTYLHNTVKDPITFVLDLSAHIEKLGGLDGMTETLRRSGALGEAASTRPPGAATDALKGLEIWAGRPLKDPKDIRAAFQTLRSFDMDAEALQTRAAALLKRTDQIPDFLMEKDPFKAFSRWTLSTFRHAAARDGIAQFITTASAIEKENPVLAEYLTNLSKDLSGIRRGTLSGGIRSFWTGQQLRLEKLARTAEESGDHGVAQGARAIAGIDKWYGAMVAGQYRYFLGLNPLTAAKNMVQPFVTTLPALGTTDPITASQMLLKAYWKTGIDILQRRARNSLLSEGLSPVQQTFEAHQWFDEGMQAAMKGTDIGRALGRGSRALGKASMFMFDAADVTNRNVTRHLASELVDALAADLPGLAEGKAFSRRGKVAAEAFASAEPAYRQSILGHIKAGDLETARSETARYLGGSTQYNYNRASMSAYGRAVGGAFSMFTKWPSVAAGDMLTLYDAAKMGQHGEFERRIMQSLWKYLGPQALAMTAVGMGWKELTGDSPRAKRLMGAEPGGWGAQDALASLVGHFGLTHRPETMFPPLAEGAVKGLGAAFTGDMRGFGEALGETALSGLPQAVFLRFMLRDAPEIFLDEEFPGKTTTKKITNELFGEPDRT